MMEFVGLRHGLIYSQDRYLNVPSETRKRLDMFKGWYVSADEIE